LRAPSALRQNVSQVLPQGTLAGVKTATLNAKVLPSSFLRSWFFWATDSFQAKTIVKNTQLCKKLCNEWHPQPKYPK